MRWVAYILIFLAALPVGMTLAHRERSLEKGRATVAQLERDIGALAMQHKEGEAWIDALRTDPNAVESVARDKMGYVREGEWVFRIEVEQAAETGTRQGGEILSGSPVSGDAE